MSALPRRKLCDPPLDPKLVEKVYDRLAKLAADPDPVNRLLAARLREDHGLLGYVCEEANAVGHSFHVESVAAEQHAILRELYNRMRMTAKQIRDGFVDYNRLPRDFTKPNPHSEDEAEFYYFKFLRLKNYLPTVRWIREKVKPDRI